MAGEPNVRGDFMAWARLSALLWRRTYIDRMQILADSGVAREWPDADQHWLNVLKEDIEAGQLERVDAYVELCMRQTSELEPGLLENPLPEALLEAKPIGFVAREPPGQTMKLEQGVAAPAPRPRKRAQTLPLDSERSDDGSE